jgi:DNA-binding transcriptional regulator YiaG
MVKFQYYVKEKNETVQLAIDDELYKILLLMKQRVIESNNDNLIIIDGDTGCLTGDTLVNVNGIECSLRELHINYKSFINKDFVFIKSYDGKKLFFNKVKDVMYSGIKEVFKLTLENRMTIVGTADHKIMTKGNEWVKLGKIKDKEVLVRSISNDMEFSKAISIEPVGVEGTFDIECEEPHHNFVANGIVVSNSGKSNLAALICACWSHITGAEFNVGNVYFNSDELVKHAIRTEEQIFDYDESLFSSMATDWQQKEQKKLIKMLLLARKKKHFYVFCIPNFFKLKDTISLDKCNGLAHTYLKNGAKPGRFVYFRKKSKDVLWNVWKKSGIKGYSKYYSIRGSFSPTLAKVLDEEKYEAKKDAAILTLNEDDKKGETIKAVQANPMYKIAQLPERTGLTMHQIARMFEIAVSTLARYRKLAEEKGFVWKVPKAKVKIEELVKEKEKSKQNSMEGPKLAREKRIADSIL